MTATSKKKKWMKYEQYLKENRKLYCKNAYKERGAICNSGRNEIKTEDIYLMMD